MKFPISSKIRLACLIASMALFSNPNAYATNTKDYGVLKPFATDGCTDFPNGTQEKPNLWLHCCVEHDLKYWAGGSFKEKFNADETLDRCVSKESNFSIGEIMFAGVAIGGLPYFKDNFRWGYGWPKMRGFKSLSAEEREEVKSLTPDSLDKYEEQLSH